MKTLLICAMDEELEILRTNLQLSPLETSCPWSLWGNEQLNLIATVCGVGKVNAAACLSFVLATYPISQIIGVGVAGGINPELHIGDIVVCSDAIQHDFDVQVFNYEPGMIPRLKIREFPASKSLVDSALTHPPSQPGTTMQAGRVLSGDRFIIGGEGSQLRELFNGDCVDMETAAWAHVAYLYDVPWVAIRSISDKADEEATVDFPTFLQMAIGKMSDVVEKMLTSSSTD